MTDSAPTSARIAAPMYGTVVVVDVAPGDVVRAGRQLVVLEAMKMEHVVTTDRGGVVREVLVAKDDVVEAGTTLVVVEPADVDAAEDDVPADADPGRVRADLEEVRHRHRIGLDANRAEAVHRRHATGRRTARENLDDLCDPGSLVEYGALAIAAQRQRRPLAELIERTPADGLITGIAAVGGVPCAVMSYDYTVLAGTQGYQNHRKTDRLFELVERQGLPLVLFAEGGGGRPGDTDTTTVSGLDVTTFHMMGRLSGRVPLIGIAAGRCFAGNAALLGCCDVIIATRDANIGMGGPAMIAGGGLGDFRPEEIGPIEVQGPNGVVDVIVADEAEAVSVAKRYLGFFAAPPESATGQEPRAAAADGAWAPARRTGDTGGTGGPRGTGHAGPAGAAASTPGGTWECVDQRSLRHVIPENRLRVYDVRQVIMTLADIGSVLELRESFGLGIVTALIRVEGRPMGLIANNPAHLGGAIDRDAADKSARFLQLCDAHGLPVLSLCDTPGFMVGPDAERTATVRHFSRMFVVGANLSVPLVTIVLRKAYGLGAQSMAGGGFKVPLATVAWPTGEIGGMGLEGAVRLGFRRDLEAIDDPAARAEAFRGMVAAAYEHGKALNAAAAFELDDVIDPADTRHWIGAMFGSAPPRRTGGRHRYIDTW